MRELAVSEWGRRLAGLSGEEIKRGLDTWTDKWPPNVESFRAACLGRDNPHGSAAYKPFQRALPKQKADKARAVAEITKMRDCLRAARKPHSGQHRAPESPDYAALLLSEEAEAKAVAKMDEAKRAKK